MNKNIFKITIAETEEENMTSYLTLENAMTKDRIDNPIQFGLNELTYENGVINDL